MTIIKTETREGKSSSFSVSNVIDIYPYTNEVEREKEIVYEAVLGFRYYDDDTRKQPSRRISYGFYATKEDAYEVAKENYEKFLKELEDNNEVKIIQA